MSQTKAQLLDPQGDFTLNGTLIGVGATFSGDVSIGGTLTKQDVTNVDSVGIVTIRSGGYLDVRTGSSINTNATGGSASGTLHKNTTSGQFAVVSGGSGGNNYLSLFTSASAAPTEKVRVTHGGQVNIGLNNLTQTTYKSQIETGTNKFISFTNAAHNDLGNEGSGIVFSRQSDGSKELSGIFGHGNTSLGLAARADITFHAGGGSSYSAAPERARITSTGKVGIGTDPGSGGNLTVYTDTPGENVFAIHSDLGTNNNRTFNLYAPATDSGEDPYIFQTGNSMQFKIDSTPSITIAANGRVGISSSIPQYTLDVDGTFINSKNVNSTGDAGIMIANTHRLGFDQSGTRSWTVRATGGNLEVQSGDGNGALKGASTGGVHDNKGNVRSVPLNTQSGSGNYDLVANDAGKCILASGNVTFTNGIFSAGDVVTIINNTNSDITIVQSSTVLYWTADGTNANRTLGTRGMATIYFTHNTTGYISGSGLT